MRVQKVPDWKLALVILLLVVVDVVILTMYVVVEGARGRLEATRTRNKENEEDVEGVSQSIDHIPSCTRETYHWTQLCTSLGLSDVYSHLGFESVNQIMSILRLCVSGRVQISKTH